jgi:hypothetical protein
MVKFFGVPAQPAAEGLTVMVAISGTMPELVALKEAILPMPLADNPIAVLLFVHAKFVFATDPENAIAFVAEPLHKFWFCGCVRSGVGLTVIVNVCGIPGQPPVNGVTTIVAVTGALPVFTAVNDAILPLPLAPNPIEVLSFVQVKTLSGKDADMITAFVAEPLHNAWLGGCSILGVGLTFIVNVRGGPVQPPTLGVTVIVADTIALDGLMAKKGGIFPLPLAARPIAVLLFVQLKFVPVIAPEKLIVLVDALLHTFRVGGCTTFGMGLTNTVCVAVPLQPDNTVTLSVTI